MYQFEFTGGEVTELTANVIAKSMYAQFNSDGNEYLLLDALVDYLKDNNAIFLSDQQIWRMSEWHSKLYQMGIQY